MDLPPNIGEQCAVVLVDPFWGGLGMAIWFSGPAAEGKCVPWEFPLFSGCPRMPSVRRAELEGSWWLDSKLDIFPLSLPPPSLFCLQIFPPSRLPILSPCISAPLPPPFLHRAVRLLYNVRDHPALVRLNLGREECYSNAFHYQGLIII